MQQQHGGSAVSPGGNDAYSVQQQHGGSAVSPGGNDAYSVQLLQAMSVRELIRRRVPV